MVPLILLILVQTSKAAHTGAHLFQVYYFIRIIQ